MTMAGREAVCKSMKQDDQIAHPGLILQRCFEKQEKKSKNELLKNTTKSILRLQELYKPVYQRYIDILENSFGCITRSLLVKGRMVIGLSTPSPLETGLTIHQTYGVPYIPGTALKGLCAHYCDQVWGNADSKFKMTLLDLEGKWQIGEYYKVFFGTGNESGRICFYDAWLNWSCLEKAIVEDVITVHHSEYYAGKQDAAPLDSDDPTPVGFLSVTGEFLFAVSCDNHGSEGKKWATLAIDLLMEALSNWGVGAKTNSGYGRLI